MQFRQRIQKWVSGGLTLCQLWVSLDMSPSLGSEHPSLKGIIIPNFLASLGYILVCERPCRASHVNRRQTVILCGDQLRCQTAQGWSVNTASCGTSGKYPHLRGPGVEQETGGPRGGRGELCHLCLRPVSCSARGLAFITQPASPSHKGPGPASTSRPTETFRLASKACQPGPGNRTVSK